MSELIKREPPSVPAVNEPPRPQNIWIDDYLDDKQSEFFRYAQIVLKRKWLVLSVTLLVVGLTGAWTYNTERLYASRVRLQIDPVERVLPYQQVYDSVTADIGTQAQVLKSEALGRRIVTRLNLAADQEKAAQLARWFTSNLIVARVPNSQVVEVTYQSPDPKFAAKAINTLADEYVNYTFETKRDATTKAKEFLEQELAKLEQKLQQSEQQLVQYGREHGILVPVAGNNVIMQRLTDLNQEMTKVQTEVLSNQYQALQDVTLESFPEKLKTSVMKDLDSRRSELEQKLATVTLQFGPKWPEVLTLNQDLAEVRQQLANEKRKALDQAKVEYNLAVSHRDRLAAALAGQNRLADRLIEDSIGYNSLQREVETDRQLYDSLLQRLKETDVSAGLKSANVHVIDRGHVPTRPVTPNVPRDLMLGLMLGLTSGIMVAFGIDLLDRTVKTPEDVEQGLRLPFLGAVPAFAKSWKEASGGILMPLTTRAPNAKGGYLTAAADVYWESYRALRTSLLFSSAAGRPNSILMTSALPGEGKSTTTVNLAIALAQTGARTVILELDMRRPKMAEMFQLPRRHGMSRYLSGQCDLNTEIQQTGVPNLFVVAAGPVPPNPPELMGSPRMKAALELLGRYFEYVIVDGPPLVPVADALIIAAQVSGVVLVVHGGKTPKAAVQKARNLLMSVDAHIFGTLVNNVKLDASQIYYSGVYSSAQETYLARTDAGGLQAK